jgi:hypothetical protein
MNRSKAARRLRAIADMVEFVDPPGPPARQLAVAIHYTTAEDGLDRGALMEISVPVDGDRVTIDLAGHLPVNTTFVRGLAMQAKS